MPCKMTNSSIDKNGHMGKLKIKIKNYQTPNSEKIKIKKKNGVNSQGFLKADAAPITTAKTIPRPAPREAPTAAAVKEDALA